jgi:protein kinase A
MSPVIDHHHSAQAKDAYHPSPPYPNAAATAHTHALHGHAQHGAASIQNLIHPPASDAAARQHQTALGQAQLDGQGRETSYSVKLGASGASGAATGAQPAKPTPRITKGKYQLGDFSIQRTLGTGSFGRVHLVQSRHNQRFYAIKVLKKMQVVKMKQVEHTNDERRMLGMVKHPFLITLWGTFQDSRNLYMVMDFVEGGELFSLLRKSQVSRLPREEPAGGGAEGVK